MSVPGCRYQCLLIGIDQWFGLCFKTICGLGQNVLTKFMSLISGQPSRFVFSATLLTASMVSADTKSKPAVPEQILTPYIATSLLYDSNYFRISDRIDSKLIIGNSDKSELVEQLAAGFDIDWKHSLQQIIIKANVNHNGYQNFSSLDYIGWKNLAQWNWQLQDDLSGEIGYANIQAMGTYNQLNSIVSNLYNYQRIFANAGYLFHPRAKIKIGWFRTDNRFNEDSRAISNNSEDNVELNLNYIIPTGTQIGVRFLGTDGRYPNRQYFPGSFLDDAYKRFNYAITWDWQASVKTRIDGWAGYTDQLYAHLGFRDFGDVTARLNLTWQYSDKTLLQITAKRDISQANNEFASFMLAQGLELNPTWRPSNKLEFLLPISYQQQDYLGQGSVANIQPQRDQVASFGFTAKYSPWDNISIIALLNYENRDSNKQFRTYSSQSASINLQAAF